MTINSQIQADCFYDGAVKVRKPDSDCISGAEVESPASSTDTLSLTASKSTGMPAEGDASADIRLNAKKGGSYRPALSALLSRIQKYQFVSFVASSVPAACCVSGLKFAKASLIWRICICIAASSLSSSGLVP